MLLVFVITSKVEFSDIHLSWFFWRPLPHGYSCARPG